MKARPKKLYQRKYILSEDTQTIRWEPSKKGEQGHILVSDIKFIRLGQQTAAFHKV